MWRLLRLEDGRHEIARWNDQIDAEQRVMVAQTTAVLADRCVGKSVSESEGVKARTRDGFVSEENVDSEEGHGVEEEEDEVRVRLLSRLPIEVSVMWESLTPLIRRLFLA